MTSLSQALKHIDPLAKTWTGDDAAPHQRHLGVAMQIVVDAATVALTRMGDIDSVRLGHMAEKARQELKAHEETGIPITPPPADAQGGDLNQRSPNAEENPKTQSPEDGSGDLATGQTNPAGTGSGSVDQQS